ncbi:Cupredoxin [Coniella lustricola]|uniref:Cupredoxin n=1 Tax=Coniella lustricola TaxID=2025994 RepID=A0A2T3A0U3_9PEZI|nr:Cupredoxin [Coniella lustricola]
MLGDYYHSEYHDVVAAASSNTTDFTIYVPWSDNSLINGKNSYNCSSATSAPTNVTCSSDAGLSQFRLQPGKTHRLRLMNVGAAALVHFSIDGHQMQVIANDFVPLVPYNADFITLGVGQRTDILVRADADPAETYWMRSTISLNCSVTHNAQGLAIVGYDQQDGDIWGGNSRRTEEHRPSFPASQELALPTSNKSAAAAAADETAFLCKNDDLNMTIPYTPQSIDPNPSAVETVTVDLFTNATGEHIWIMNNRTQYTDYNMPALRQVAEGNDTFPGVAANVYNWGTNKTVRIVVNTVYQSAHPWHMHGHDFQVLAEGPGAWDGDETKFVANPLRRDTHMQRRYGYLVVQVTLDNPGVWSYHCHIAWHSSMGLNIVILEEPEAVDGARAEEVVAETCTGWDQWTMSNTVDQIDAGI